MSLTIKTNNDAYAYLMKDGNLRVPCSRYGHDSATCAEVAVRVWDLLNQETGEETIESLEHIMGLVVNDHDDPEHTLRHYGTVEDHERFEVPMFVVTENTPGYLPDSDDPATFQTFAEALDYAREERDRLIEFHTEIDLDEPAADLETSEDIGDDYASFYVARDAQDLGRVITVERIED